jgi:3-isopropylmalate dehydrogenase
MLLRWSLGQDAAAAAIESAVSTALDDGLRTRDLVPAGSDPGGTRVVGTQAMADAVIERIAIRRAAAEPVAAGPL